MIRIAIVEDEDDYVSQLTDYLKNTKNHRRRLKCHHIQGR